jgi:hypothetical protein
MKSPNIKINHEELIKERQNNFKERLWFINYWTNYIRTHPDEVWSQQQKVLIDAQIKRSQDLREQT